MDVIRAGVWQAWSLVLQPLVHAPMLLLGTPPLRWLRTTVECVAFQCVCAQMKSKVFPESQECSFSNAFTYRSFFRSKSFGWNGWIICWNLTSCSRKNAVQFHLNCLRFAKSMARNLAVANWLNYKQCRGGLVLWWRCRFWSFLGRFFPF